jgi:hypothetical protein
MQVESAPAKKGTAEPPFWPLPVCGRSPDTATPPQYGGSELNIDTDQLPMRSFEGWILKACSSHPAEGSLHEAGANFRQAEATAKAI